MSLTLLIINSVLHTPTHTLSKISLCDATTGKNNSIREESFWSNIRWSIVGNVPYYKREQISART